jgi:hypothetical protein
MLLITSTSTTSEAHCYAIWHYPWRQHCANVRQFHANVRQLPPAEKVGKAVPKPEQARPKIEQITILVPPLDFVVCPEGDERLRLIGYLRMALNAR